jgi:hypothetical protein
VARTNGAGGGNKVSSLPSEGDSLKLFPAVSFAVSSLSGGPHPANLPPTGRTKNMKERYNMADSLPASLACSCMNMGNGENITAGAAQKAGPPAQIQDAQGSKARAHPPAVRCGQVVDARETE